MTTADHENTIREFINDCECPEWFNSSAKANIALDALLSEHAAERRGDTMTTADKLRELRRVQVDNRFSSAAAVEANDTVTNALLEIAAVIEAAEQVREHDTPALVRDIQEAEAMWASLDEMYKALSALARRLETQP